MTKPSPSNGQALELLQRPGNILEGMKTKPLSYIVPQIDITQIDSNATLYSLTDDTLPLVNLRLVFEGGSASETEYYGAHSALASYLKLGGAGNRSGEEIANALASIGASIDIGSSDDSFVISVSVLHSDFNAAFSILENILLKPNFDEAILPVIQSSMKTGIQRRNDRPESIAQRKLREAMFLPDRRGHSLQINDVDKLSVPVIKQVYSDVFSRRKLHIALDGNLTGLHAEAKITELIKEMPPVTKPYIVYQNELPAQGLTDLQNKILLVKKDVSQAVVTLSTFIPAHNDASFYTLQTGNYILGGGSFVSRLMQEVRAKRGLAYHSSSRNDFDARYGRFIAGSGSRANATAETLRVMIDVIKSMDHISNDELKLASDSIVNSLVFQYDNPSRLLAQEIRFRMHKMPENYLDQFQAKMNQVTTSDVKKTFAKYIDPSKMWIVVVGPETLKSELEKIRPVVVIDPEESLLKDQK